MAETRSKRAEAAGNIATRRNAQAYWAKKEAMAEELRNPKVHAFTISFDIKNFHYSLSEFQNAYDETIAKTIEQVSPSFPPELREAMGYAYIPPQVPKGHFMVTQVEESEFNFIGGYHAKLNELNELFQNTIPATISYIQEIITNSYVKEHGTVTLSLYTKKDEELTHVFRMEEDSNEFTLTFPKETPEEEVAPELNENTAIFVTESAPFVLPETITGFTIETHRFIENDEDFEDEDEDDFDDLDLEDSNGNF
jgi:hypothetical protein